MANLPLEQAMQTASQHHQAGRLAEAEKIYRQILAAQPDHADALHLLGALAGQVGHLDTAIDLIGRAIRLRPDFPEAYNNLACALALKGRLDDAIAAFKQAIQLKPTDAEAYNRLGGALKIQGRLDEAITAFSKAIELRPVYAEAHTNLGDLLRTQGRLDEAIAAHSKAIALRPDFTEAHTNLGNALKEKGLIDDALDAYSRQADLKKIRNNSAEAQFNLAKALHADNQLDEAVAAYAQALQVKPDHIEAHQNMGLALYQLKRFDEALLSFRRALDLMPDNKATHQALGLVFLRKEDAPAAADSFRRALAVSPDLALSWNGLGEAMRSLGQFAEASNCFRRALELSPSEVIYYTNLASTGKQTVDAQQIQRLNELLTQPQLPIHDRIAAGFAQGKLLDESEHFDQAFERYAQANKLAKKQLADRGEQFDIDNFRRQIDRTIETFTPQFFADRKDWGDPSQLPVFVVGMPRSGTTLVEQIAASHPQVFGAGERTDIAEISTAMGAADDKTAVHAWSPASVQYLAKAHLKHIATLGGAASRVIDKMPSNILELGVISLLFPNARIIICRRDARDNCLSLFFQWFSIGNIYTYDLVECAQRYQETQRLTAHWLRALPLRILQVQYEEMVADLEGQCRRLIDFLGLPWNPACLEFHKTQRTVLTASVWQVRQPIYNSSVGRWRHYERHLQPLLDALATPSPQMSANSLR